MAFEITQVIPGGVVLSECPFCGFSPDVEDDDCIYPATADRKVWGIHCYETGGGCSAQILGDSPEDCIRKWQNRVQRKVGDAIQAYPSPPENIAIAWYTTPEQVHRLYWEESAKEVGLTYEEMIAESTACGETLDGEEVEFSFEQEMEGIRMQKCWAFCDLNTNMIHAWACPTADTSLVVHMLAHEIGHLTGTPDIQGLPEELRADQYGKVAGLAYNLLQVGTHRE